LPGNVDGNGLPLSKLKANTSFYLSSKFLDAFTKFQTGAVIAV